MVETPEEVLQIRLQHPSDFAAGDDLIEGRQSMMGTAARAVRQMSR